MPPCRQMRKMRCRRDEAVKVNIIGSITSPEKIFEQRAMDVEARLFHYMLSAQTASTALLTAVEERN